MTNILLTIVVGILSLGAVPDNEQVNNAGAINRAIELCSIQGGGVVTVPQGTFTTGTIYLKDNVHLRLEDGAILKGSPRLIDYESLKTSLDLSKYESGQGTVNYNSATDPEWSKAMIFAVGVTNSGIEGNGTIDGNDVRNPKGEEKMRGPHTIIMAGCKNLKFQDFTVQNSANYAFLAYKIEKSTFKRLNIRGGWDGIHIRGCKNVEICDCNIHTGDDALAGGYWENTTIRRCILNSSCNGIRMIMPSTDVEVADCNIYGPGTFKHITSGKTSSDAAINIEPGAWGKAPGRLDNIRIRRVIARTVLTPLSVTLGDDNSLGTITVEDLTAYDITRMAMSVKSWGNKAFADKVKIRRAVLEFRGIDDPNLPGWFSTHGTNEWPVFPCWGLYLRNVKNADLRDVTLTVKGKDYRTELIKDNVDVYKAKNIQVCQQ